MPEAKRDLLPTGHSHFAELVGCGRRAALDFDAASRKLDYVGEMPNAAWI